MWSPEEQARWPEETRVLVDLCLQRGRQMTIDQEKNTITFQFSPDPLPPVRVIYREPRLGPRRRFQEKPSRVPAAVENNRRRLDGRRR